MCPLLEDLEVVVQVPIDDIAVSSGDDARFLGELAAGVIVNGARGHPERVDEARHESLYELKIAFQQMAKTLASGKESLQPWLVDRLAFLIDRADARIEQTAPGRPAFHKGADSRALIDKLRALAGLPALRS